MSPKIKETNRRILLVGTVPYKNSGPTRSFETYFSSLDGEDDIAQIFSNPDTPCKGQCSTLFQITDRMLLKRVFDKKEKVGKVFVRGDLQDSDKTNQSSISTIPSFFRFKKTPFKHLLRKFLWKKKRWKTEELDKWLDDFRPNCVVLSFSNDFFILDIAKYVSKRFGIPIVSIISDDYYFNSHFSLSPFYYLYRFPYKRNVRKLLKANPYIAFISDKIALKYNNYFGTKGKVVHLSSSIKRRAFKPINSNSPVFSYFGNLQCDRYKSIVDIANSVSLYAGSSTINVYSSNADKKVIKAFKKCKNIHFCGSVSYEEVLKKTYESDVLLLVENFTKKNINATKYSLSTKVADSIRSGVNLFGYGSSECGMIEYLVNNNACVVCDKKEALKEKLMQLLFDKTLSLKMYETAGYLSDNNHDLNKNGLIFLSLIDDALKNYRKTGFQDEDI